MIDKPTFVGHLDENGDVAITRERHAATIGCFFHLGLKKTTALCQNWVREWQCREECSNGKLGAVRGNRGISYGELIAGRCLHEFCGERYY